MGETGAADDGHHQMSLTMLLFGFLDSSPSAVHELCYSNSNQDNFLRSEGNRAGIMIRNIALQKIRVLMTYLYSKELEMSSDSTTHDLMTRLVFLLWLLYLCPYD